MELNKFIVSKDVTILKAMDYINENMMGIVYVCDEDKKLLGSVTDGNVRRYILKNGSLTAPVTAVSNPNTKFLPADKASTATEYMNEHKITSVPILDKQNKLISIKFLNGKLVWGNQNLNIPVVIMAGGKGTRLYPYTEILPKPLIPIGEKTITEHIMEKFEGFGCTEFNMIVNYKRNLIKSYFLDCDQKHDVSFTDEYQFMGTGGGLKLLNGKYNSTFFMTNCDVLLEEDYADLIRYHRENHNIITLVCAMKNVVIPYGTVEMDESGKMKGLREKPSFSFLTNTGIYVIEPEFVERIPDDKFVDITDLITECINEGKNVGVYPVSEQAWMDMGQLDEMEKMKKRLAQT